MSKNVLVKGILRKDFSRIEKILDIPYLLKLQKDSYEWFLQKEIPPEKRGDFGLQGVFKSVFPITNFNGTASLEFVSYTLGEPRYDVDECRERGMTYSIPLKVKFRLVTWETDDTTKQKRVKNVKEQDVYFGEIPLMTETGTFVINGTERVVVNQLHRSPGVFFEYGKGSIKGKILYTARIIPQRGSWLDFEFDTKDILYARIDRRKKFPVTIILKALGYSAQDILSYFYDSINVVFEKGFIKEVCDPELLEGKKFSQDIVSSSGELLVKAGRKVTKAHIRRLKEAGVKEIVVGLRDIVGWVIAKDVKDPKTGEIVLKCNEEFTDDHYAEILKRGIREIELIYIDGIEVDPTIRNTLLVDKVGSQQEALLDIYKRLRPSDSPNLEVAQMFFHNLFFDPERYDLSRVGRLKMNQKLGMDLPLDYRVLTNEDILRTLKHLIDLKVGKGVPDDIDSLVNRRVRAVGELLEAQLRIGLLRIERAVREKMSIHDLENAMPNDVISPKPVIGAIREFFGSSQLSQFMDQTNPLSEITHKRRLSALGPGGLTRERAGFEVRDVHPTHYGRICPIETPEGPNIGLIVSLTTYARVNEFGFIETPYRKVENGVVTKKVEYLSPFEETEYVIAQANALIDEKGRFKNDLISARRGPEFVMVPPDQVDYMDISPNQVVSVAASLIPFLENDDANRALMGSNMQRQALPLLRPEPALIGTGMEKIVAKDSGATVIAHRSGVVEYADARKIIVRAFDGDGSDGVDIYRLKKFECSNQNTCINQKPLVKAGDVVNSGDIIADGAATCRGELSLGRNVLVAFMPWCGYNFEDSILISEKLVREDAYTSIHIEEFEVAARDTKLGNEEITKDIPNVGEEALKNLDEDGIVRIGAWVKPGDILVGKVTPKGETQLSPEEKLLRAIFGEKARDVKDTSLRVPPGVEGVVIDTKVFSRKGVEDVTNKFEIEKMKRERDREIDTMKKILFKKISELVCGKILAQDIEVEGKLLAKEGESLGDEILRKIPFDKLSKISVEEDKGVGEKIKKLIKEFKEQSLFVKKFYEQKIERLSKGDELPPGVLMMVKVSVAVKGRLCVGDKMAGRHGNKGVLSKIVPEEDMPYLSDGTPVEMVLNPLGVPSRMNVGQLLETHLGWASRELGKKIARLVDEGVSSKIIREKLKKIYKNEQINRILDEASDEEIIEFAKSCKNGIYMASPVFDGATEDDIRELLKEAGLPETGQTTLFDGRTGEPFDQKVTVGVIYMMKLNHRVDDKIHARSIGPYSLVTQQPLGGKAQFGGQRLGEMEVWAIEAYGAAYTLQEFLTVKSDDVVGRSKMYESIVKGECKLEPGLPESFKVLVKELKSLALDVELIEERKRRW